MYLQETVNSKTLNQLYSELWSAYEKGDRELAIHAIGKIGCVFPDIPK